jgi:hypothetical protein
LRNFASKKDRCGLIIMGLLEDLAKYGYKPDMKCFFNKINLLYLWLHTENGSDNFYFDLIFPYFWRGKPSKITSFSNF